MQVLTLANDYEHEVLVRVERTASREDAVTAAAASSLALFRELFLHADKIEMIFDTFLDFRTYQQEAETSMNPDSPLYWGVSAEYFVEQSTDLPLFDRELLAVHHLLHQLLRSHLSYRRAHSQQGRSLHF